MFAVQLSAESFAGLVTVGLYLHDCSLTHISADLLAPLNSTLRYLWLNGNELDHFDVQLADSFARLHHLRLGSNPLRCDCGAAWLRLFYERHVDAFRGALPPSCFQPARLRGRQLADVDPAHLRCRPPSFTTLEVRFDVAAAPTDGHVSRRRLLCAAVGDPTPTLYWIQPDGRTTRYERPTRGGGDAVEQVEAVLELTSAGDSDDDDKSKISGLYTCIANNNVGNVTMTVVVPTQPSLPPVVRPDSLDATEARRLGTTTTTTTSIIPVSTPAILQSILLGDSLLQLQRLAASSAASRPPPYSLLGGPRQRNYSTAADVAQPSDQQHHVPVASSRARSVLRHAV